MTRRFEFVAGNSAKFWAVAQEGTQVTVNFGRLGAAGQIQTKSFDSHAAERQHAERLIAQKTAKGYVESSSIN